jgi:abortive infection bacteriophage resistance protein
MPAKTRQQIASEYGISTKTLKNWLKNADIVLPTGSITPYYQQLICEKLGDPNYEAKR